MRKKLVKIQTVHIIHQLYVNVNHFYQNGKLSNLKINTRIIQKKSKY